MNRHRHIAWWAALALVGSSPAALAGPPAQPASSAVVEFAGAWTDFSQTLQAKAQRLMNAANGVVQERDAAVAAAQKAEAAEAAKLAQVTRERDLAVARERTPSGGNANPAKLNPARPVAPPK